MKAVFIGGLKPLSSKSINQTTNDTKIRPSQLNVTVISCHERVPVPLSLLAFEEDASGAEK